MEMNGFTEVLAGKILIGWGYVNVDGNAGRRKPRRIIMISLLAVYRIGTFEGL
jgi:hypothetical protein